MPQNTKVNLGFNRIERLRDLDELARLLFPGNRNHQKIFLAIFLELKYAEGGYLPKVTFVSKKYDVSRRSLQRVRSKTRKLGLIDHVSRFSQKLGYREGWILSTRFERSLEKLAEKVKSFKKHRNHPKAREKDFNSLDYV
jgi:hypothetical protein